LILFSAVTVCLIEAVLVKLAMPFILPENYRSILAAENKIDALMVRQQL
jgi:hypothetical protein